MRTAWLVLLLAPGLSAQEGRVVVTLEDGSRVAAKGTSDPLEIRTGFGDLRIPLPELRSMRRLAEGEVVVRTARLQVQGALVKADFSFETDFGRLKVPARDVKAIDPSRGRAAAPDDTTVLFWSFEDVQGDQVADLAGGGTARLADAEVQDDAAGFRVFARRNENGYAQGAVPEGFRFAEGPFTIEVRVKVGAITRGYATLLACNDEANAHERDFWFLVQAGGQLYFDSGSRQRTNFVSQTSTVIKMQEWTYLAVACDVREGELRYYVNGKRIHTDKRALAFHTSNGPLFLGPGNAGKAFFSCPERFQFVRVSKGARTDDEIAEMQKTLESDPTFSVSRPAARGVGFRDGGFVKAELPSVAGAKFRTRFGTLEIAPGTRGRIELYPMREKDVERIQSEVARHIEALGARTIDEREEAQKALLRIGGPAVEQLRKARDAGDPEVQSRIDAVLRRFQETGVLRRPVCDVLRMGRTVVHGWLDAAAVEFSTPYGTFRADLSMVGLIALSDPEKETPGPLIRLRSGEALEGDPRDATLAIETEFGALRVPMKDVLSFRYDEEKRHWIVRTEKAVLTGKVGDERIPFQTPAGPLSVPLSEMAEFVR